MLPLHHDTIYWKQIIHQPLNADATQANNTNSINNAKGIHNGAVTHHHDHAITLHNFNTIKTIANKPQKLMPPPDDLLLINNILN